LNLRFNHHVLAVRRSVRALCRRERTRLAGALAFVPGEFRFTTATRF